MNNRIEDVLVDDGRSHAIAKHPLLGGRNGGVPGEARKASEGLSSSKNQVMECLDILESLYGVGPKKNSKGRPGGPTDQHHSINFTRDNPLCGALGKGDPPSWISIETTTTEQAGDVKVPGQLVLVRSASASDYESVKNTVNIYKNFLLGGDTEYGIASSGTVRSEGPIAKSVTEQIQELSESVPGHSRESSNRDRYLDVQLEEGRRAREQMECGSQI
ncbi:hypothetical protein C8R45DRAFT_941305 [Mycena sanguinolenta]|nr:hypothetical protein C8R45DRAFT_941305 [Mycena sanguinolenta]